ncbi:hypothetical protein NDU88_006495 [Pleurodeles waltl]|uniref:Uncharacterized protein n=1 Tax=Pleurodeles waltl TaxID=8319 RepID=A0AAV7WGJ0_PLEWA|nr:hypothetical protein NDU88_006495 [Pleurodeles waltl]
MGCERFVDDLALKRKARDHLVFGNIIGPEQKSFHELAQAPTVVLILIGRTWAGLGLEWHLPLAARWGYHDAESYEDNKSIYDSCRVENLFLTTLNWRRSTATWEQELFACGEGSTTDLHYDKCGVTS